MIKDACDLNSCFLCTNCITEWKELIALKKKTISVKKGELIFAEGDVVTGIYFINSGAVKVHKLWADKKELIIRFAAKGNMIGHRGVATGNAYPVSATALTNTSLCFIDSNFLETTLKADPALTYKFMQFYLAELQKAELRMRNLALMDIKGRIAGTLTELQDVFGKESNGYITVPVTRQDIASYAGTTYETVFKYLKSLERVKIIHSIGKSIRINDYKKLAAIAKSTG